MKILEQRIINAETEEVIFTVTHIYAENGHFERNGKRQGWHIALGGNRTPEDFDEVIDAGVTHTVPESLEDEYVEVEELEEPGNEGSNN